MAPDPRAKEILLDFNEAIEQGHTCAAMFLIVPREGSRSKQHIYVHCETSIYDLLTLMEGAVAAKDKLLASARPAVEKAAAQSADPRLQNISRILKDLYR
ncbi:MAG: hypothetical protein NW241_10930 [Bacteroidia bacterium]|nr:hypothetical protein [Bacteroidia bacterium]